MRGPESIKVLTVYACPLHDQPGLRLIFLADRFDGDWPLLLARDIPTSSARNLDEILDSHPEESVDPALRSRDMRRAVNLVINAISYTTSKEFETQARAPYRPGIGQSPRADLTGDVVFYLPGKIVIDATAVDRAPSANEEQRRPQLTIGKRFWVRRH